MEERKILAEAAEQSAVLQLRLWRKATQEAIDAVRASGTEILYPDKAPFVKAVESVYRDYRDRSELLKLANDIRAVQ
jgi:TRAP-type C4-dicarboxylate transport system substrate-binding protein